MNARLAAAALLVLLAATPASPHRLDEYLQATTLSIGKGRIRAEISLTPGAALFPVVMAGIDADHDGALSVPERQSHAERVLRDLTLSVDGRPLALRVVSSSAASVEEMKVGEGAIELVAEADVPAGAPRRSLVFENHHARQVSVYLANCLVPADPAIRITSQGRSGDQSEYRVEYVVGR